MKQIFKYSLIIGCLALISINATHAQEAPTDTPIPIDTAPPPADDANPDGATANADSTKPAAGSGDLKPLPVSQRLDGVYEKHTYKEKEIIPYDHIREADIFWQKRIWRIIDTKEKINLPFRYPKELFFDIVHRAVLSGEITAFSTLDDEFTTPITIQEVKQQAAGGVDSVTVTDADGNETIQVSQREFNPENVTKFRLKEDWFFDEETSTIQVRIIGLAPILDKYDPNGNYLTSYPMYWIYYPDLRPILVRHEVYNIRNDAERMSWEDLMEFRMFGSTIIKESNVYDRTIQAYAAGIDGLLEAERIKNEIFLFEHDLWSY